MELRDIHEMADAEDTEMGDDIVGRHATDAATQVRVRDALQRSQGCLEPPCTYGDPLTGQDRYRRLSKPSMTVG